jgi:serine/threonine-protein kinase HipA
VKALDIWLNGRHTASIAPRARGNKISIEYTNEGCGGYREGAPILSCSLPAVVASQPPAVSRAYLEGLLPEGNALAAAAARLRGVRLDLAGAPATPADVMALLTEYGRECTGAVVVLPTDEGPPGSGHPSVPLRDRDIAELLGGLGDSPLGTDPIHGIRMSLGGAQDKLLLTNVDDRWCRPVDGYPSTHILKPTTVWPHSSENEALVLALSRACGLSGNATWVQRRTGPWSRSSTRSGHVCGDWIRATGWAVRTRRTAAAPPERLIRSRRTSVAERAEQAQFIGRGWALRSVRIFVNRVISSVC